MDSRKALTRRAPSLGPVTRRVATALLAWMEDAETFPTPAELAAQFATGGDVLSDSDMLAALQVLERAGAISLLADAMDAPLADVDEEGLRAALAEQ